MSFFHWKCLMYLAKFNKFIRSRSGCTIVCSWVKVTGVRWILFIIGKIKKNQKGWLLKCKYVIVFNTFHCLKFLNSDISIVTDSQRSFCPRKINNKSLFATTICARVLNLYHHSLNFMLGLYSGKPWCIGSKSESFNLCGKEMRSHLSFEGSNTINRPYVMNNAFEYKLVCLFFWRERRRGLSLHNFGI